jgi:ornithine carbamoyltransferase
MKKDIIDLSELTGNEIIQLLNLADKIKASPEKYSNALARKTLLMIFEKPSLRTRLSFEAGMTQLGGHAIYYDVATSPMGKGESIQDTAKTASRYVDIIMARIRHDQLLEIAKHASVPVINAMTDLFHPCQILGDFQTIREKKGRLDGLRLAFVGDANNNITHSLLYGCPKVGITLTIACPEGYGPQEEMVKKAKTFGVKLELTKNPEDAVKGADIVMTDTWVSYYVPADEKERRIKTFSPYQVTSKLMKLAHKDAIFMHCLPAVRGMEMTADVIDGPQSVVFDQAENRLHIQKAIMLKLLGVE